jgi:hypothetical protein
VTKVCNEARAVNVVKDIKVVKVGKARKNQTKP